MRRAIVSTAALDVDASNADTFGAEADVVIEAEGAIGGGGGGADSAAAVANDFLRPPAVDEGDGIAVSEDAT